MKNFTKACSAFLLLCICSVAGFAQSGYKIKSSNGANIRQGAGSDKSVIATIPAGSQVKVVEKTNDSWYKVEYNGKTGYVSASLIEEDNQKNDSARTDNSSDKPEQKRNNSDSNNATAQKRNSSDSSKSNSASRKKSNNSGSASSYNWGIGLRLGDPSGITVKKYTGKAAWEFNLGRSSRWGYRYDDDFYRHSKFEDKRYYRYYGYTGGFSTALQVHYLLHKPINGAEGLKFYYGGGAQIRFTPITYRYYYDADGNGDWWGNYREERVTNIDLGLDGVLGLEYTFKNAPVSVFVDANLFIELVDSPFLFSGQGGIGVRYNF